ncbi:carboxypeptidase regulatory-like domain-containing protein [Phytohabitans flavus]|uniref:carboxypeptidase regulatory-like domain-containing protein n=1 Tax=Phytohabitans flavus TaxID=1076124 RepID=UPI001E5A4054|nr:carboxypeptidase regulatory-like domain-containing protein [Phytohabitans flavus]
MGRFRKTSAGGVVAAAVALVMTISASPAHADDPAPGAVTGRVVTEAPGAVTVNLFTTGGASAGQVRTGTDGSYTFPAVPPGTYKIQYGFLGRFQWSHQKLGFSAADVVAVTSGQSTTVVEETMLLPGVVEVVATDAVSGAPVDAICAGTSEFGQQCGATGGVLRLTNLAAGPHTIQVRSSDGLHARAQVAGVYVVLGQATRVEVSLAPTTAISTTVVDRASGQPVSDVCVLALPMVFHEVDDEACQWGGDNRTDEHGRVTIGELPAAEYTLLAVPEFGEHGVQWVGRRGGVGRQHNALKIQGQAGVANTVPAVKLDPMASITGVIRDAATGEPILGNGCASVVPGLGRYCTDFDGVYTIPNLGPYDWPVQFSYYYPHEPYASIWSGGATDRRQATPVRAGTDVPGQADAALAKTGTRLEIRATTADGQPYNRWLAVRVYNARTGDLIKEFSGQNTPIDGIADQPVRIWYVPESPWAAGWYGGTDFASAKSVRLEGGATKQIKLVLPDPA